MFNSTAKPADFTIGQRVQMHPGTDRWMMGDRYGTVVKIGRTKVWVRTDRSWQVISISPTMLEACTTYRGDMPFWFHHYLQDLSAERAESLRQWFSHDFNGKANAVVETLVEYHPDTEGN